MIEYIPLGGIIIYRNTLNIDDIFSKSIYCIPDWDEENHMEIIIKGKEVLNKCLLNYKHQH
ncbi:hypothetical protein [uncultured Clostridium sp.]|uniref:hypothetical protein n=1 Tax=uncultured Clostridium sp. TaxID=59620 RepID=UPI0028E8DC80|nr:hypothetical protein [uncultured Clostridium sp.]